MAEFKLNAYGNRIGRGLEIAIFVKIFCDICFNYPNIILGENTILKITCIDSVQKRSQ